MKPIICVKISQKMLRNKKKGDHPYSWFPFERVYLTPVEMYPIVSKMFRYYFHMELDHDLFRALNDLEVDTTREIFVDRDDEATAPKELGGQRGVLLPLLGDNPKGWTLIVPTHIAGKYRKEKEKSILEASRVMYVFSKTVRGSYANRNVNMPRIALHTPFKEIPVLCTVCERLPDFHNDECSPGRNTCGPKTRIELKADDHFRANRNKVMKGEP